MSEFPPHKEEDALKDDKPDDITFVHYKVLRTVRAFINENGQLATLFGVVFVNLVGFGIIVPLMSFFAESLRADPWQVTLMFTAFSLGQFFSEPLCGRLSDIIGRKPILLVTTGLSALFYLALGFAPNIWIAIIIRFLCGLASGNVSTIQAYIADVTPPEHRSSRLSLIGAAFSLGFLCGPALGLVVGSDPSAMGLRAPLFIAAGLAVVATLGVMAFVRESKTNKSAFPTAQDDRRLRDRAHEDIVRTLNDAIGHPAIVSIIACTLCYMGALAALESTFGLWSEARYQWHPRDISIIFLYIGLSAALMQMVFTKPLVKRFGERIVLAGGLFVFGLSFALQALNHDKNLIIPLVVMGTMGQAVVFANVSALISKDSAPERQGAMLGLNQSTGAMARIIAPVVAGFLFTAAGIDAPLWMGAVLCLAAAGFALNRGIAKPTIAPQ